MARKKHKTPEKLDYLFERRLITKSQYAEFWGGYWEEKRQHDKDKFIDNFISDLLEEENVSGGMTLHIEAAKEQAEKIGGYVVRRNKQGRFSKTGKRFQAVKRGKHGH